MDLVRIGGRSWALPIYFTAHGIYVNRSLAERENIDPPPINWTVAQYMQFVTHSRPNDFYGAMDNLWALVDTGHPDLFWLLRDRGPDDPFVRLDTEAVRNVLRTMVPIFDHVVWSQNFLGNVDHEFLDANHWNGERMFANNRLLTHHGGFWQLRDFAHPDGADHWLGNIVDDWDVFPRPSTPYMGNHVGVSLDPFVLRNFAMDDGNPILSPEEYQQMLIAWNFVKFYVGDTRAWRARADQLYYTGGTLSSALTDGLPIVTGQAYHDQMDIWFSAQREMLRDPNDFPGWHFVLELIYDGQFPAYVAKTMPMYFDFEGSPRHILHEWWNRWNPDYVGAFELDPAWLDHLFARLPDWTVMFNERFEAAFAELYEAIERFYPIQVRGGQ